MNVGLCELGRADEGDIRVASGFCLAGLFLPSPAVRCDGSALGGLRGTPFQDLLRCSEDCFLLLTMSQSGQIDEVRIPPRCNRLLSFFLTLSLVGGVAQGCVG